ncbi:MAG: divalent-cation tolerance protein CutA [Acidobacteriaceae bacterium]|nr:divalent-cation tolerance protein CutA [Acidobacteriaceae bacterium]
MSDDLLVFSTCADDAEATRIANALVSERLAACVNVSPPVTSIYRWQGKVETAREVLLIIKTTQERFPALQNRIISLHSYDTPEIIAVPITNGSEQYLSWLRESVGGG